MFYQEHLPHPGLAKHIKCYWTLTPSTSMPPTAAQHFLADGGGFSFNLADPLEFVDADPLPATIRRSCICGPMTQPLRIRPTRRVEIFGVRFQPGGSYPFFPCPPGDLINIHTEINDLWGKNGLDLIDNIQDGCPSTQERINFLNRHLLQYLDKRPKDFPPMSVALNVIDKFKGQVNIHRLAKSVGLSTRQLERRFKERVGLSPKQLCRNLRFKNVFKHLATSPADSWVDTALACGYYDQAHMIRDFKHYTGTSPAAYFRQPEHMKEFITSKF